MMMHFYDKFQFLCDFVMMKNEKKKQDKIANNVISL